MNAKQRDFYEKLLLNNVPEEAARFAVLTGRHDKVFDALVRIGMNPRIAWAAAVAPVALEAIHGSMDEADVRILTLRARHEQTGEGVTLEEASDAYEHVLPLQHLAGVRGSTYDNDARDKLIVMQLERLEGLGLGVTSHREKRSDGMPLPESDRRPSLALAMHQATGIGEGVIAAAWRERKRLPR